MRQSNAKTLYAPRAVICAGSFFSRGARRGARRGRGLGSALSAAGGVAAAFLAGALLCVPRAAMASGAKQIDDVRVPLGVYGDATETRGAAPERVEEERRYLSVPFETVTVSSPDMYEGETAVITEGRGGLRRVTTRSEFYEGEESPRETVSNELVIEPVTETIAVGAAERPLTASFGEYIWPARGPVSSWFGYRRDAVGSQNHKGIDIAGERGDDIYAADGGEVILADNSLTGFGLLIQIRHDNGDVTYYAHNSKLLVSEGERVQRGQVIAEMGATGVASGVHCHFELRRDGNAVNPVKYLP